MNHQAELLEQQLIEERATVTALEAEKARLGLRVRELDLMFGRYVLGMRAALIESEHGKGAEAGMTWIFNGLAGPGELPPEDETDAQAYFDREIVAVNDGMSDVIKQLRALAAAPAPAERLNSLAASNYEQVHGEKSRTHGMSLGERIAHVGGRTNAAGYTEFGSVMAVDALINHVLRDLPVPAAPDVAGLVEVSSKVLAKLQHPTHSVNILDTEALEKALATFHREG